MLTRVFVILFLLFVKQKNKNRITKTCANIFRSAFRIRALDSIVSASRDENCRTKDNDDNNDVS